MLKVVILSTAPLALQSCLDVRALPQVGTSVLHKLVKAAQAYLGLPEGGVRAMTLQAGNRGAAQPHNATHVWLVGPDATALHHSLLYRREQVSTSHEPRVYIIYVILVLCNIPFSLTQGFVNHVILNSRHSHCLHRHFIN